MRSRSVSRMRAAALCVCVALCFTPAAPQTDPLPSDLITQPTPATQSTSTTQAAPEAPPSPTTQSTSTTQTAPTTPPTSTTQTASTTRPSTTTQSTSTTQTAPDTLPNPATAPNTEQPSTKTSTRPHIILIIADDLGWNDVGFHGMNHIPTPNLDALAAGGVALQRHYVTPLCSPSRAALLSGVHPIHSGMQHGVIYGTEPRGLPLRLRLLPQYLRALGYRTHLVGKWHLGSYRREYLPMHRGFESHVGFWTGRIDMYDHTSVEHGSWGFDFRRGYATAHDLFGKYATDVYTDEAIKVVDAHNASEPLFLLVAHSAVHSGNPYEPLRAPPALIDSFRHINDTQRQRFAGMLSSLDSSVGAVVAALGARGFLENSIIVFSTDNGGAAAGFNDNAASNYPLRGTKNTPWEGGVRGAALIFSPLIKKPARVATQAMHLTDWLPTLISAAGGDPSELTDIDGVDQWAVLSEDAPSIRTRVLHNIDPVWGYGALTVGPWKIVNGTTYGGAWDGWPSAAGRGGGYAARRVLRSRAAAALRALGRMPGEHTLLRLRAQATISCGDVPETPCEPLRAPCLFNVEDDPCERNNRAQQEPEILSRLWAELRATAAGAAPPRNAPLDPRGDPRYWGRLYTNFLDYERDPHTVYY